MCYPSRRPPAGANSLIDGNSTRRWPASTGRPRACSSPGRLEEDLGANPEQVVGPPERAVGGGHRAAEHGVFPVEVDLEELIEVPVAADVDHLGVIGPEVRVGQAGGE